MDTNDMPVILQSVFPRFSYYNLPEAAQPSPSDVPSPGAGNDGTWLRVPLLQSGTQGWDKTTLGRWKRDDVRAANDENRRIPYNETGQFRRRTFSRGMQTVKDNFGGLSTIYVRGSELRIWVIVWVMVRVRVRVWVSVMVKVNVVLLSA